MAKTFRQMVAEARAEVPAISPAEAKAQLAADPNTLVLDVRDAAEIQANGRIPGSHNVSLGMVPVRADQELPEAARDPKLQDRSRPIITTCAAGGQASLAAKLLKDMGFTNVKILDGGTAGWKNAGYEIEKPA